MPEPPVAAEVAPNPGSVAGKTIPVRAPTWNTPEFPAERPREEDRLAGRRQLLVECLLNALVAIPRTWNRPFEVVTERGLYFEVDGRWRHCDPDIMVLPCELEGDGAVRCRDMAEAPLCVFEIASPKTVNQDWVQKKAWHAGMGVAEYWMVDPVSESTAAVRTGALIDGGPLQGWQWGANGRDRALSVAGRDGERAWAGYSPVLRHELILSQVLHGRRRDGGLRLRDPATRATVRSHEEMLDDHEELQSSHETLAADHEELTTSYRDALADREELVFNLVAAPHDPDIAQRMKAILDRVGTPLPETGLVMTWLAKNEGPPFLKAVRRHCGLPDKDQHPAGDRPLVFGGHCRRHCRHAAEGRAGPVATCGSPVNINETETVPATPGRPTPSHADTLEWASPLHPSDASSPDKRPWTTDLPVRPEPCPWTRQPLGT